MKRTRSGTVIPIDDGDPSPNRSRKICLVIRGGDTPFIYCLDAPESESGSESQSQSLPLPEPVMVLDSTYPLLMGMASTQSALYFMGGIVYKKQEYLLDHEKDAVYPKYKHPGEVAVLHKSVYKVPFSKLINNTSSSSSSLMVKECDLISIKVLAFCEVIPGTGKICVGDLQPLDRFYGPSNFELFDEETGSCSKLPDPLPADSVLLGSYISDYPKLYLLSEGGQLAALDLSNSSSNDDYNWVYLHIPCLRFWEAPISTGLILKGGGDVDGDSHLLFPSESRPILITFPSNLENLSLMPAATEVQETRVDNDIPEERFFLGCFLASGNNNNNNPILYRVHCGFIDEQLSDIAIDLASFDLSHLTLNSDEIRSRVYVVQPPLLFSKHLPFFYDLSLV